MKKKMTAFILSTLLFLTACQTEPPVNTPTGGPTEGVELTPTNTPTSVMTPEPTNTLAPTSVPQTTDIPQATDIPEPTNTPQATKAPIKIDAPFAMVSPVPQSEIADIVGTMTVETYPVVDGSTATLPLSEAVFMVATGESAEVAAQNIKHTKTTNSYYRLYEKEADLLIVYEPAEAVVERMKTEPILIKPIGLDALVFMANAANEVDSLTLHQLIDIYSGQITNWSEVGGNDRELLAFQRPVGSGSQSLMQKLVMGDVEMASGDNVFRYNTMSDILEGMLSYNGEDNTLGYSVFYYANNMYFEKDLKFMAVEGVLPSTQTIYDGTYPCINAFYAAIRVDEPENSNARKIFDWLTGEAGQQLVLDLGYVPVQMPEGANISDAKTEQTVRKEVLATEPLSRGEYFVTVNPQNMVSDFYYGDMTVYDSAWKEVVSFYNVTLNNAVAGVHKSPYLPVGQIRQNSEGTQEVRYGIYDLEKGQYTVVPCYKDMQILDAERCYYAVPQTEEDWMNYQMIGPHGEVLVEHVAYEDWLTISACGNGYLEFSYDYINWENGCTYRFYDENLKLVNVFCQKASAMPNDADREPGVGYYLIGEYGCLLDENGEVLITADGFLSQYGDGEDMNCILPFYQPIVERTGEKLFGIYYQDSVYVVDRELNLFARVYDVQEYSYHGAYFYEDMYSYWDEAAVEQVYKKYDGSQVILQTDGRPADEVVTNWSNQDYLLYARDGKVLYIEEHPLGGEILFYEIQLREEDSAVMVNYEGNGYVCVSEDSGETIQNMYSMYYSELPLYHLSLYRSGKLICEDIGVSEYSFEPEAKSFVWIVSTGEVFRTESESVYDDMVNSYSYCNYAFVQNDSLITKVDRAYLMFHGQDAEILLQGNYIYAISPAGETLVRELQNLMGTD